MKLTDIRWVLLEIDGTPAPRGNKGRYPELVLTAEGKLSGFAGCNRFMGGYHSTHSRLQTGPLATTRMACPQGMELERRFLQTLQSVDRFRIEEDTLNLYNAEGHLILRFGKSSTG